MYENVPVNDAVTVAYAGLAHVRSHVLEAINVGWDDDGLFDEILEDTENAMAILRPHVRMTK